MVRRYRGAMAALALLAACPPGHAVAGGQRDFVAGPWKGVALFGSEDKRFRGCTAGVPGPEQPKLVWIHWNDRGGAEVTVRNPPWTLREGQTFQVRLSIDDAWHVDAAAEVLEASGGSRPASFSILPPDLPAFLGSAASGRTLTIEREGESRFSLSLSGVGRMLDKLDRCLHRGIALQRKADDGDYRASDLFVAQEDAEGFARWADELSKSAHAVTTVFGLGDGVRLAVNRLSGGKAEPQLIEFLLRFALDPAEKEMETIRREWAELPEFHPHSGDPGFSEVLRESTQGLLDKAESMLRDAQGVLPAMLEGDRQETRRLYAALARRSYLSYAGDNAYLTIRNASRSHEDLEYHLNRASRGINHMNVALIESILFIPDDALAEKMPALIATSKDHVRDVRRWSGSGREILIDLLSDTLRMEESQAVRDRIEFLGLYAKSLDEEEALAHRFEAALNEVEKTIGSGASPTPAQYRSLVHGGEKTAAALLARRFSLRVERGAAH